MGDELGLVETIPTSLENVGQLLEFAAILKRQHL